MFLWIERGGFLLGTALVKRWKFCGLKKIKVEIVKLSTHS
jgi:hypothetical protein